MTFNKFQQKCAAVYGGGDYAHVTTLAECEGVGDTLFLFLMRELADEGAEPLDQDTAEQRLESAVRDIEIVLKGIWI